MFTSLSGYLNGEGRYGLAKGLHMQRVWLGVWCWSGAMIGGELLQAVKADSRTDVCNVRQAERDRESFVVVYCS
jgi:hypothetical protein